MGKLRSIVAGVVAAALLAGVPAPVLAQEGSLQGVFQDALYGGLTGALVGGALLVFTDDPGDHLSYVAYGAAAGVIAGALFGLVESSRPLAEVRDGRLRLAVPTPAPLVVAGGPGGPVPAVGVTLFRARF